MARATASPGPRRDFRSFEAAPHAADEAFWRSCGNPTGYESQSTARTGHRFQRQSMMRPLYQPVDGEKYHDLFV
jgi:hypothetical protein